MATGILARILRAEICPYCHKPPVYTDSLEIMREDIGMIYLCRPCNAYVRVHPGTDEPMGGLANAGLRRVRRRAHDLFDSLFEYGIINRLYPTHLPGVTDRQKAYMWLAKKMNKPEEECHIGMMDVDDCYRVIDICNEAMR